MRVIAGQFKGRRLAGPEGPGIRPTSDSLRETLFNILGESIAGAQVLDAFAGTGALGLEAISRGAARVTFVERDRRAIRLLQENIRRCGAENACAIVGRDFFDLARERARASERFGVEWAERAPAPRHAPGALDESTRASDGDRGSGGTQSPGVMFDLVLIDPPYDEEDLEAVMRAAGSVVAPAGRVVLEHSRRRASPDSMAPLGRTRLVIAGDSALSFYQ
jgi:16S rRNA (guanine966-N2)-methyltransferase